MILPRMQHIRWLCCYLPLLTRISASSVTVFNVLRNTPELSIFNSYVNASSDISNLLSSANGFTLLAPSNDAISTFISNNPNLLMEDLIVPTIQYSLLQGVFPSLSFTNESRFVQSHLTNATYANITGGQAIELVLSSGGTPQAVTGNKTVSIFTSADIVCTGGLVHIIDSFITLPTAAVLEISEIPLEYFVGILTTGGYLSTADSSYVDEVLNVPDVTYLIPNTAEALANFTQLSKKANASELEAVFQYHFVPGWVGYSSLLKDGMMLKTAQGSNVSITIVDGDIYVNAARVIASDYLVANGVVHVIDDFLDRFDTSGPPSHTSTISATATTTPSATSASTHTATTIPTATSSSKTSGATIGIAVGVSVAGIIVITSSISFILHKKRRRMQSRVWDQGIMSSGKFYLKRGQVQRQEDLALGLQSTDIMAELRSSKSHDRESSRLHT